MASILDPTSVLILRIVTSIEAFLALSLNAIVIYMVLRHSPKEFRNFASLILWSSIAQIATVLTGFISLYQQVLTLKDGAAVIASFGLGSLLSPDLAFQIDAFAYFPAVILMLLPQMSMTYRIYLLHYPPAKRRYLFLILLALSSFFMWIQAFRTQQYYPAEEIFAQLPYLKQETEGYFVFGIKYPADRWETTVLVYSRLVTFHCSIETLILRQILLWDIRRIRNRYAGIITEETVMHKESVWMLTIQGSIPLFLSIAMWISFFARKHLAQIPIMNSLAFAITGIQLIIDPLAVLICLPNYRHVWQRWLFRHRQPKVSCVNSFIKV